MGIIYSMHAEYRALERGIKKVWIEEAIKSPDKIMGLTEGRKQAIKRVENNKVISVVYTMVHDNVVVITVYWGE
ncbi:MAG: DUF4258 domain-containing protein [Candidatus Aenigmarchaeota archaeon]|nr:DUF4258 domain-containing protein [Candidatus Aenigmarchaeota archaeon]